MMGSLLLSACSTANINGISTETPAAATATTESVSTTTEDNSSAETPITAAATGENTLAAGTVSAAVHPQPAWNCCQPTTPSASPMVARACKRNRMSAVIQMSASRLGVCIPITKLPHNTMPVADRRSPKIWSYCPVIIPSSSAMERRKQPSQ